MIGWIRAIDALLAALCTIAVLSAFHFTSRTGGESDRLRHGLLGALGRVGRKVMMIGFGALIAGALMAAYAVLRSRLDFLVHDWLALVVRGGL